MIFWFVLVIASLSVTFQISATDNKKLNGFQRAGIHVLREEERVSALNFSLKGLGTDQQFTLSDYENKLVVINYWATWCPPCRAEMPSIESLHQELKEEGLAWLAINSGETEATVKDYISKKGYTFPVLLDPDNTGLYRYGIQSLPATLIVNKAGLVVALGVGSVDWRNKDVLETFRYLLSE